MQNRVRQITEFICSQTTIKPKVGIILGSGLGDFAEHMEERLAIPYVNIPGFPLSSVVGHKNNWVMGKLHGVECVMMQGRFHCYEGTHPTEIVLPIWVMKQLGVQILVVTNAAGGINYSFNVGDLMAITDFINFSGFNPLLGKNIDDFGPRFPSMTEALSKQLRQKLYQAGTEAEVSLVRGVYLMTTGPSFETPAEIRMMRTFGADAVGMSTVPEIIAANHCGIKVCGITLITNMAAGISGQPLTHEEVLEAGVQASGRFKKLLDRFVYLCREE